MSLRRVLSVTALTLVVVGAALLVWSVAPAVEGVDAPETVTDTTLTGPAGATFPEVPFAVLNDPGNRYTLEVRSDEAFVIGERRSDRPDDPIRETGARSTNAGGQTVYLYESAFVSTVDSNAPANPAQGPKEFYIRFPDADTSASYELDVTKTPVLAQPLVAAKAWASLYGLGIAGAGAVLYVVRAAMPKAKPRDEPADEADEPA